MTLITTSRSVTFTGNGSTTEFAFTFKIPLATDLVVQTFDTVSLALATIDSSDYTVTGIGDNSGGTVTYPLSGSPIASTVRIIISRLVPFTQLLDIQNQGGFFPDVVENQLDLIVMQIQQSAETIGRGIAAPIGDNITDFTLPLDEARASKYLFFGSDGSVGVTGTAPAVQYQGAFNDAGEPTLRLSGSALVTGDLYFNTTNDVFKVYDGVNWITAVTATPAAADVTVADSGAFFADSDVEAVLADIGANYAKLAGPAFTDNVTMAGKLETNGKLQIDGVVQTIAEVISSGANISLSMTGLNKKTIALATNTTITVSGEVADQVVEVWITQTSGGGTAAWSGVDKWIGGSAPTLSVTTGQIDIIILSSASDGTTIIGQYLGTAS